MNSSNLRRKLLLRRMSISAPTLSIGAKSPLWLRLLSTFVLLALAAAVGGWLYDLGSSFAGFNKEDIQKEIAGLRADNKTLFDEREKLSAANISAESKLAIELATAKKIIEQNKVLEADNAQLKEDLSFFESLLPATGAADSVTMRNVRAQLDAANERLLVKLLVMQAGKQTGTFEGSVQISVAGTADGKPFAASYPAAGMAVTAEGKLSFTRYQRVELAIPVPTKTIKNLQIKTVNAKVMQGAAVRAQSAGVMSAAVLNLATPQ